MAIESTWRGDFYTVLNAGLGDGRVVMTLVDNPMICWIWGGGFVTTTAAIVAMWPVFAPPRRHRRLYLPPDDTASRLSKTIHERARPETVAGHVPTDNSMLRRFENTVVRAWPIDRPVNKVPCTGGGNAVEMTGVSVVYGRVPVLCDIDLAVARR